jgi:hypothetical protein
MRSVLTVCNWEKEKFVVYVHEYLHFLYLILLQYLNKTEISDIMAKKSFFVLFLYHTTMSELGAIVGEEYKNRKESHLCIMDFQFINVASD